MKKLVFASAGLLFAAMALASTEPAHLPSAATVLSALKAAPAVKAGHLQIVGAVDALDTGRVAWLPESTH